MVNSADPDQLASSEANWSGSTLFAKAGYIRVQQDSGDPDQMPRLIWVCTVCQLPFYGSPDYNGLITAC